VVSPTLDLISQGRAEIVGGTPAYVRPEKPSRFSASIRHYDSLLPISSKAACSIRAQTPRAIGRANNPPRSAADPGIAVCLFYFRRIDRFNCDPLSYLCSLAFSRADCTRLCLLGTSRWVSPDALAMA